MRLSMVVLLLALVLAPAETEAESEKKIELMLDMSIAEVKELKGKPITQVNLDDTTTVLSYDDVKLVFGDDKLVGQLGHPLPLPLPLWETFKIKEEELMRMMRLGGISPEEIEKFKKTYTIPSMRFGQADPETIELTLGMPIVEVVKLKGMPNKTSKAKIGGEIKKTESYAPKGLFLFCEYDDIGIIFRNGKLSSVR